MTIKKLPFLEWVFILIYAFISINPKMNALVPMPVFLFLELIYCVYIVIIETKLRHYVGIILMGALVIALMYVFTTASVYISQDAEFREIKSFVTMFCSYLSICFPMMMTYRLLLYGTEFQKKSIFIILILLLAIIFYVTWEELKINERIMKSRMSSSLDDESNMMVGGYVFICATAIMLSSVFYAFRQCNNKILRWLMFSITCFLILFIVRSLYTIALIAGVIGMCYTMRTKNYRLFVPSLILILFLLPILLQLIINVLDDGDIKYRMMEIYSLIMTGTLEDGDLSARIQLYRKGLVAFLCSPLWGNYKLGFNPHSTIIELLASVGLWGFLPFVIMLKKSFNLIKKIQPQWSITPVYVTFLFMALTNPIHSSHSLNIAMWFLGPLLYDRVTEVNARETRHKQIEKFKI